MLMNQEEIKKIIPHRSPMLLVSSVEELVPGESIRTTFYVDPQMELFKGHFPGDPVLPGVYSVETPLFLGINNVRFKSKILPGDTVEIRSKWAAERPEKAIVTCAAELYNHGELAVTAEIVLALR